MNAYASNEWLLKTFGKLLVLSIVFFFLLSPARAEFDWVSMTLDNDLFVGNDNGYTNGIYFSLFDVGDQENPIVEHDFWVFPLMWSMPKDQVDRAVNSYMLGQTMSTPSDITIANPGPNELPYSAVLALTNSYVTITPKYADSVSTTIGVVGPAALGEEAQKLVHSIIGADEPQGWDTQLKNELVFRFSRSRTWRTWASESGKFDLLTNLNLGLGTLQSALSSSMTIRYGENLLSSYATSLFNSTRTANPTAVNRGWFVYAGVNAGYVFNQIFTDGNTFRDSRSIDYDHEFIGLTAGLAYSWENLSVTFSVNDANIIQSGSREETLENLTQYGSLSLAWRM